MAIIINDPYSRGGGQAAGERFEKTIGGTLERLANRKIQHMENDYNRKMQLKEMFENQQLKHQQRQAFVQRLVQNGYDPKYANVAAEFMDNPKELLNRMELPGDYERQQGETNAIRSLIRQPGGNQPNGNIESVPAQSATPQTQGQSAQPRNDIGAASQGRMLGGRPKEIITPGMRLQAEVANAKMDQQERFHKEASVEKSYDKASKDIAAASEKIQAADASLEELNTIRELNKTGQLFQGPERALLEKFKLEEVLTNAPTQIAQKAMSRLVIDTAKDFKTGGRLTNDMFKMIEKGIPNLLNRPEALEANAALTEAKVKLGKARAEEQIKVVRDFEGKGQKLPAAWKDIAEKRLAPTAKQLAKESLGIVQKLVRQATGKQIPEDIHPAADVEPGSEFELNGKLYEVKNGQWREIKSEVR